MALLQAIVSLISRSAGKVLNAIFGWAVRALFGQPSPKEQTLLSVLVALAAAWPLLLLGVALPKIAAMVIAFVPLSHEVPKNIVRLVWLGLALIVPIVVGIVVAAKAPPATPPESFAKRMLRGFPITVGLAAAFLFMFVTVPILRLLSLVRGKRDEQVPLMTHGEAYHRVAGQIFAVLNKHQFGVVACTPPWWMTVPSRILLHLGGKAFRNYMPERLEYFASPRLEVALYPNGLLLRGRSAETGWAHGLLAEALTHSEAHQTFDVEAQALERGIRAVWFAHDEGGPNVEHAVLVKRVGELARRLGQLHVGYDEWQILYRQLLQLDRALSGEHQLLDESRSAERHPGIQSIARETRGLFTSLLGRPPLPQR